MTQVSSRHPVRSGEPGTSTLRSVQHYQSLNLSSPRVAFSSGNRRSFQHLQHPRFSRLVSHCHHQRLVALSSCPLVIKVCCPSRIVVWEGSVSGALSGAPPLAGFPPTGPVPRGHKFCPRVVHAYIWYVNDIAKYSNSVLERIVRRNVGNNLI